MNRISSLLAIFLVSSSAFARGTGIWVMTAERTEKAANASEFISLQAEYPDYLGKFDASKVASATITFRDVVYQGQTVCTPDDERLNAKSVSYQVCMLTTDRTSACTSASTALLPMDPCDN